MEILTFKALGFNKITDKLIQSPIFKIQKEIPLVPCLIEQSISKNAIFTADQLFKVHKKPLVACFAGLIIQGSETFPGLHFDFLNNTLGAQAIIDILKKKNLLECHIRIELCYMDSNGVPRLFSDTFLQGRIIQNVLDKKISSYFDIFKPLGFSKPLKELDKKDFNLLIKQWSEVSVFNQLLDFVDPHVSNNLIKDEYKIQSFGFSVPRDRIALEPAEFPNKKIIKYDSQSQLISHHKFSELGNILPPNTLIVINDSKVVKAALRKNPDDGTYFHIMHPDDNLSDITVLCPWKNEIGEEINIDGGKLVITGKPVSGRDIRAASIIPADEKINSLFQFLERYGSVPIPIYVNSERRPLETDYKNYQNSYAVNEGSIAAPVAGLNFSSQFIALLKETGHEFVNITLHIGYGTWKSLKKDISISNHKMDTEMYFVSPKTFNKIQNAKLSGRPILAVGTTSVRTLESIADEILSGKKISETIQGSTNLFIYPPYQFKVVDMLFTTFAYPKTPIMAMAAAFANGIDNIDLIYKEALAKDYRFFSYGDNVLYV